MQSPFPGMDPYLEGDLWPDVHHALASQIRRQLIPLIQPRYVARISRYVVEDQTPEDEIGIMYPDVEILSGTQAERQSALAMALMPTAPLLSLPVLAPIEVTIPVVEIRDVIGHKLITAIEILSPVNKRTPGLEAYVQKRRRMHQAGVHFLEIDLLRRGTRTIRHPHLPKTDYLLSLIRAGMAQADIWPVALSAALPILPVPLSTPDADVPLDLAKALREVYQDAAYHLSIDYHAPPPPPALTDLEMSWVQGLVA